MTDTAPLYRLAADGSLLPLAATAMIQTGGLSLSVAGALDRFGARALAADGYLMPYRPEAPAPHGWGPAVRADSPDGYPCALILPAPAPLLADVQGGAIAALEAARGARLAQGWWCELDLGQGSQWYRYAGDPPEDRALIAGALLIAQARVALGEPDASPYRCAGQAEIAAGWPPVQRLHTAAQLAAVLSAGGYLLAALGQMYDVGRATIEAAQSAAECEAAVSATAQAMETLLLPPDTAA